MRELIAFLVFVALLSIVAYIAQHGLTETARMLGGLAHAFQDGMK